jgi:hypothetical protein
MAATFINALKLAGVERNRAARILVISTNRWASAGHLSSKLSRVGFEVGLVCPKSSPSRRIRKLDAFFAFRSWSELGSIKRAIEAWSPAFLICTDDEAVNALHRLYYKASKSPEGSAYGGLIELSLGRAASFTTTRSKSELVALAQSLGVRCPLSIVIDDEHALDRVRDTLGFPVFVKADQSSGGDGVRLARNEPELIAAIRELSLPCHWPARIRKGLARLLRFRRLHLKSRAGKKVSVQQPIPGRPVNRAVVCWQGKVLAGITVEAIETLSEFGPSTVVKTIDRPDVAAVAEKIVATLGLSGFLGFDFVRDDANQTWFLEMNPRATPTCHLAVSAGDLVVALFTEIIGSTPEIAIPVVEHETIALFPGELRRSRGRIDRAFCFHDMPADEPDFVRACLRKTLVEKLKAIRKKI